MARPSVREARKQQILDAFEVCVARYGVEGTTLERMAAEAGLARALIRHHMGNRDDLLRALVKRFTERSDAEMSQLWDQLPAQDGLETLVTWLFDPDYLDLQQIQVAQALIAVAGERPEVADAMGSWTADFIGQLERVIADQRSEARPEAINAVAVGIAGIYFNWESLAHLGESDRLRSASMEAAKRLLDSLD